MSQSEQQFSGFVFMTHAAYSALCILLKVGCVLLSLISIFHAIETCIGFSLVLTERTFKPQQGHSLTHLHFTGRFVRQYLYRAQRASRSKPFSTFLKSAPIFPSQQRERKPWSAPLPKNTSNNTLPMSAHDSSHLSSAPQRASQLRQVQAWEAPSSHCVS